MYLDKPQSKPKGKAKSKAKGKVDKDAKEARLERIGVTLMQGFLLYRPMEAPALETLLRQEQHAAGSL